MSEIKIKCPNCGKILRIADTPNVNKASFVCPVCHEKSRVGDCQRLADVRKPAVANEETDYGARGGEETQYGPIQSPSNNGEETLVCNVGSLVDKQGKTYKLSMGVNTVGRKAKTSDATVQIEVADMYMSRSHAIIEVTLVGSQVLHSFRKGKAQNPSYFNGMLVADSDRFVLNDGDRIKLGETELTFKK